MGIAPILLALPLFLSYPNKATDLSTWMTQQEQRQMGIAKLNEGEKKALAYWIETYFDEKMKEIGTSHLSIVASDATTHTITLNDDSVWKAHTDDSRKASWWSTGNNIKIISGTDDEYPYIMILVPSGETARAQLISKPLPVTSRTKESYWLSGIDNTNNMLQLSNQTLWNIAPSDLPIAREWLIGDTILIYDSTDGVTSHILVNSMTKQKIHATPRK